MSELLGNYETDDEEKHEVPVEVMEAVARPYGTVALAETGAFVTATLEGKKRGPDGNENYHS